MIVRAAKTKRAAGRQPSLFSRRDLSGYISVTLLFGGAVARKSLAKRSR